LPELPDVEVFRRYLNRTSLHKTITDLTVLDAGVLRNVSGKRLRHHLKGASLESTQRRGKHMLARANNGRWITFHFGMTGYLEYFKPPHGERRHDRVVIGFLNGFHLAYVCPRKFGRIGLVKEPAHFFASLSLGPDALKLDPDTFRDLLRSRRGKIKPALMDQSLLAGIGNIYSDEMLFQAGIHPDSPVSELTDGDLAKLFGKMVKILETAIDRKADPDRMPRTWLLPHRKEGAPCPRCGGTVERTKISGRSAYFCTACLNDAA
jgi:formamidopyrimidine-DNA glycosylase